MKLSAQRVSHSVHIKEASFWMSTTGTGLIEAIHNAPFDLNMSGVFSGINLGNVKEVNIAVAVTKIQSSWNRLGPTLTYLCKNRLLPNSPLRKLSVRFSDVVCSDQCVGMQLGLNQAFPAFLGMNLSVLGADRPIGHVPQQPQSLAWMILPKLYPSCHHQMPSLSPHDCPLLERAFNTCCIGPSCRWPGFSRQKS